MASRYFILVDAIFRISLVITFGQLVTETHGRLRRLHSPARARKHESAKDRPRTTKGPDPKVRPLCLKADAYLMIFVTVPAPTVRPPSRMAKPRPSSMAIGWISSTVTSVVSPGMTISVPSGSVMTPVTSVVRK